MQKKLKQKMPLKTEFIILFYFFQNITAHLLRGGIKCIHLPKEKEKRILGSRGKGKRFMETLHISKTLLSSQLFETETQKGERKTDKLTPTTGYQPV